ncbi:anti-sigma factor family protein [Pseudogemmobacter sonorensis]|uniref:anti-sigma factor family protein n=1 Tax=Pseudogemmobacter sonorensis TaxID=2989681 RepID=UPI0036A29829
MDVSDEMLMALADGELDLATAQALRARLATDPGLTARFEIFRRSAEALRAAMDPGPVPERLLRSVLESGGAGGAEAAGVVAGLAGDPGAPSHRRTGEGARTLPAHQISPDPQGRGGEAGTVPPIHRGSRPSAPTPARRPRRAGERRGGLRPILRHGFGAGLAAALLALAFGLGFQTAPRSLGTGAPDPLLALGTGGTADLPGGGTTRVLGSYETDLGLCRILATETGTTTSRDILCHEAGIWQVALSIKTGATTGFAPASDLIAETLDLYLDGIGAGSALEPHAEAEALARSPQE